MFQKLIFTDEKLKMKSAIAEREPNDSVCYVLLYRRPALAHGGPLKFKVVMDGHELVDHPLANGYYLFLAVDKGRHSFSLTLPGSVTSKTNKQFETTDLDYGELQIIEVKIVGALLPETKVTIQPKLNFCESIWGKQQTED